MTTEQEPVTSGKSRRGMVFGVFDGLHPGHEFFLREAMSRSSSLCVVVAADDMVRLMKKKSPRQSFEERSAGVRSFSSILDVVPGDSVMGEWKVLKDNAFDVVFLGYDQQGIQSELDRLEIPYEVLGSHYPEKFKSSIIR